MMIIITAMLQFDWLRAKFLLMKLQSEPPSFAFDFMEEWRFKSSQSCGKSTSCQSKSFKTLFVEMLCEERKDLYVQQLGVA